MIPEMNRSLLRLRSFRLPLWCLISGSMLLTGCAIGPGQDPPPVTRVDGDRDPSQVTLTLWHDWTGQDAMSETMRELLGRFQREHPSIEVRPQAIPRDVYRTRIKTMAAADELPDVFLLSPDAMTREFVGGGLIQPVDELLEAEEVWTGGFLPHSLEPFTVNGRIYSAPLSLAPSSFIFYNRDLFEQYGAKVPETWDELLQAIRIFNRNGIIPIALGNKASWVAQACLFSALAERVTGTDWFVKALTQDEARFTDPVFIEALSRMQELVRERAFQDGFNYIDNVQMKQLYVRKQAAMFVEGAWAVGHLIAQAPPDVLASTGIALLPGVPGGKGNPRSTSGVIGAGLALNRSLEGARKEAAFKLIYALSGPEAQRSILRSNTLVSYRLDLDRAEAHPLFAELHQLMRQTPLSPAYDSQLTTAAADILNESIAELLKGGRPQDAAQKIQDAQASALGKFR